MTKSATATPGVLLGHVNTVNMEGSWRRPRYSELVTKTHFTYSMVECHSIDNHEVGQVILVRVVVAMPTDNIKRGVSLHN